MIIEINIVYIQPNSIYFYSIWLNVLLLPFGIYMNYSAILVEEIELGVFVIYRPCIYCIVIRIECYVLKQFIIGCNK